MAKTSGGTRSQDKAHKGYRYLSDKEIASSGLALVKSNTALTDVPDYIYRESESLWAPSRKCRDLRISKKNGTYFVSTEPYAGIEVSFETKSIKDLRTQTVEAERKHLHDWVNKIKTESDIPLQKGWRLGYQLENSKGDIVVEPAEGTHGYGDTYTPLRKKDAKYHVRVGKSKLKCFYTNDLSTLSSQVKAVKKSKFTWYK